MESLTGVTGSPQLSEGDRWMEVARVVLPAQQIQQEVTTMQQRFIDRFQGSRGESYMFLFQFVCLDVCIICMSRP